MKDPAIPPPVIEAWKSVYPHAEEHRLETASHFLQEDEPEHIVELLRAFLRRKGFDDYVQRGAVILRGVRV